MTFTTPKSKQYKEIFERRRKDLKDLNIDVKAMGNSEYFINCLYTVAQFVGQLTRKSGVLGLIPCLATYFRISFH